jgi:peptidoglycan/xylan/chitin deacetylase (PgdA/CDA1 family)
MLRSLLKTGAAFGLQAFAGFGGSRRLPLVLGYHRTVEEFPSDPLSTIPAMCVSTRMLERQLDWIGRRFRFVSLDELGDLMESGGRLPERVAAVTFDDGYHDFYEHAFPLLKRKGIPAAVFVVTDLIGTSRLQIHDALYLLLARAGSPAPHAAAEALLVALPQSKVLRMIQEMQAGIEIPRLVLEEHRSMSWEEVIKVRAAGITIGSHTRTHALLPNEEAEIVETEAKGSREMLEEMLGEPIRHFAYPCGQHDAEAVQAVARAGYRFAYTVCKHRDESFPLLTIPRKLLWEKSSLNAFGSFSPSIMNCHVNGSFDLFAPCKMKHFAIWRFGDLKSPNRQITHSY